MTTANTMSHSLPVAELSQLFRDAHTHHKFADRALDEDTLRGLHELSSWGPTSLNCQPARYVFVRSAEAKQKLRPALSPGNADKTMAAPATVIVAHDSAFHEELPSQFPANPAAHEMFANNAELASLTALRNGTLQGAYLMLAARAGSGSRADERHNVQAVNDTFFPDSRWKANFLVNLGWPDPVGVRPRGPRLAFDRVARVE
jgi:3-hydroxypropanoate dehydrogenase